MTPEEIKKNLSTALDILYRTENDLIIRHLHEQTIVARLMLHLQHLLPDWCVDVEFNRQGEGTGDSKEDTDGRYRKPDLVIHRRGSAGPNLAIITVKAQWNKDDRDEAKRICRNTQQRHGYLSAFFVELMSNGWLIEGL